MLAQLAREGITADWFGTAEEALLAAAQRSYDLVLTDLNPGSGMGNAGLAKALRSMTPPGGDLPIVALTAWDSAAQGGDLFYPGIDDYVIKPVLEQALFFRIRRLIERRRLLAERALTTQRLESEAAERAEADRVAQAAMRSACEGSQRLMDSMSEGAYGVDNDGHCTFVNQAFLTMLGYDSASALLGKKIHAMIHHSHADGSPYPAAQCKALNCRLNNRPISVSDEVFWTRSGKAIAVEYRANPVIREGEVVGVMTTFLDITRRRAAEAHALRQEQLYACLSLCRHAIVHSTNQYQLFDQVCRIAVDSGGLSMAWVGLIKADTGMVKPVASWGDTSGYLDDIQISISANSHFGRGPSGIAIREKEACWWQSLENFPTEPWRERLDLAGWACAAALPIFQNDVVVGVLALYSGVSCFFEEDAKSLLRAMVSDVSYALDNFARDEQRRCAELALQDSEYAARLAVEKMRSALEQLTLHKYALDQHAIVANVDLQGKITYANDRFCKISGYSRDELLGQDHVLLNSGEHPKGFFKAMYQTIVAGKVWQGEICDRARGGHLFWVDTTIVPFMDSQGKPTQYIAIRSDITVRKQAELEKNRSDEFIRKIAAQAPGCLYQFKMRADGSFCAPYASEGLRALYGLDPEDVREDATKIISFIHPDDLEPFLASVHASAQDLSPWKHEYRLQRAAGTGTECWIAGHALPQRDADGSVLWHGFVYDVTAKKQAETLLRDSERDLQETQRIAQIGWYVADIATGTWTSSPVLDAIFGIDPAQEKTLKTWSDLIAPAFQQEMLSYYARCLEDRSRFHAEYQIIRQNDGQLRWVAGFGELVLDAQGQPVSLKGAIQDITERKTNEQELAHYRSHLEELVHEKTQGLALSVASTRRALTELEQQKFVLDQQTIVTMTQINGRITYCNDKFLEISGFTREEVLGKDHALMNSGHHPAGFFKAMYETIASGAVWHAEICNRARDGHLFWVDTTVVAFMGEDGMPREYIAVRTDITERKRSSDAAHAANQAKSAFLSNMSHEIRTPMNGVIGMVDILKESKLDSDQRRMLDVIHNSSLALLNILNDILDYSKIEAGKLAIEQIPTHLREVAEGVTQLLFTTANDKAVELSVFVSPELPTWIASDPTRLRQILLNLLGNALKFTRTRTGRQGRVILRVTPYVYAFTDSRCGLRLSVSDNGIGMSREVQDTLFQPFTQGDRSTARRFGGTGLGLSISQRLVEMMNGRIVVRSTEGEGSEFTVELPLQTALPGRALAALPSLAGLRVLAVTTLPYDREIIPAYCHSAGAEVTLVADLAAARHEIQQSPSSDATVVLLGLAETAPTHELDLPVGVGVVRMGLRSKRLSATEQSLLVCPLLYKELIQGIALASGRLKASDFVDHPEHCALTRPPPPSIEQALASRRLILLAEDNETNREVMQTQLNILGYAVETAEDGVVALKMWQSGRYALLLTDCHMPRMNGFELTAAIREAEFAGAEGTHRPIIAVTANVMQGEAERCFAQGMDDYLAKPLRLNELGQMLGRWLPAPAVEGMASADGVMPAAASPRGGEGESMPIHCAIWDATVLTRMVGDNPAMHCRLLKKFLVNAGEQVRRIVAASATGDAVTVGDAAHPLKSSARTVGALQLGELGELLEAAAKAGEAAGYGALAKTLPAAYSLAAAQISKHLNDQP
jgi:PAS domain S-box-containing protein